jgi:DNA-binding transcriptional MerR regulator
MRDLCSATGLPRQAIHFYIQQGVLHPGVKTGRNTAEYDHSHVDRIRIVRRLQAERFLPLKAIKALLDGQDQDFTEEQRAFLGELKEELRQDFDPEGVVVQTVTAAELLARTGLEERDLNRALSLELVAGRRDENGELHIAARDTWALEIFGEMRQCGFSHEIGFEIDDVVFYGEILDELFRKELKLVSARLADIPAERAAAMIRDALPKISRFLSTYHEKRVAEFVSNLI